MFKLHKSMKTSLAARITLLLCLSAGIVTAHPEPDIPVRTQLQKDGTCTVTVEVDPRCFSDDPIIEPYTLKQDLDLQSEAEKKALLDKATDALKRWVEFVFEPQGTVEPQFVFDFTGIKEAPLQKDEDPVMLRGVWKTKIPADATGWRIRATKETPFAVVFRNYVEGIEQPRFSVLFPGETSFILDLLAKPAR